MPDLGRPRLSNLDPQRARPRLGELGTTARLQLGSVRGGSSGWSPERGLSHCALWHNAKGFTSRDVSSACAVTQPCG